MKRLISLIPALLKLTTLRQMEPPLKPPLCAGFTTATVTSDVPSENPQRSLRKRKAAVLRTQPVSSDSELSPLSDEESVIVKKPAKKKRKVATNSNVVLNEGCSAAAGEATKLLEKKTRSKRKAKTAVAEVESLEYTQEDQIPKKRKRKPTVIEPVVYDIPDVERKETTFRGELHPQVSASTLMGHPIHIRSIRICTFLAPPISHWQLLIVRSPGLSEYYPALAKAAHIL